MVRYFACVWNDGDVATRETANAFRAQLLSQDSSWQVAVDIPGLWVCHVGSPKVSNEVHFLRGGAAGVVLGRIFLRRWGVIRGALGDQEADHIVSNDGQHLIERYWGSYVAFLHNRESSSTSVLRDPTSGLSCLTMQAQGVDLYWCQMEDAVRIGLGPFHVNWPYVIARLCYTKLHVRQTGLKEVSQILGGECVRTDAGRRKGVFLWDPLRFATADPIEDVNEAADELRISTQEVVGARASCYDSILLTLSGGLDSSIVLACLRAMDSSPKITCLNYYSPGSDTDERTYARIAAQRAQVELIERLRNSTLSLKPLLNVTRTCAPASYLYWIENGRAEALLARNRQAGAVFSGYIGDQGFVASDAKWGAADFSRKYGIRPALIRIAMNAARMDRLSIWSVLLDAIRFGLLRRSHDFSAEMSALNRLVLPEAVRAVRADAAFTHPWLQDAGDAPVGKIWHALQLSMPWIGNPLARPGDAEREAPLYSQPYLEACMRIAIWVLTRGGRERGLARYAFQASLPREIVRRRTKGGGEEHLKSIVKHNQPFIREFLLDGDLFGQDFLDRRSLEQMLKPGSTGLTIAPVELFDYLDAQAWLLQWQA